MKKVLVCALALLLIAAALAEGVYYGEMVVMHCQEWVSLRSEPSTDSQRLAKVPLGTAVQDCVLASGGFIQCEYKGMQGYILGDYLEPIDNGESASGMTEASAAGSVAADDPANAYGQIDRVVDDVHVVAARSYSNGTVETLDVTCYGAQGEKLWSRALHAEPTELTCTAAYIGGTAQSPRLMLYSYDRGLMSCDLRTGAIYWTLTPEDVHLGASLSYALAEDGTMIIGGYYGPDPVAIDMDGNVLWKASAGDTDIYWLYELKIKDDCIAAHYDQLGQEGSGWVYYGFDGKKLGIERD